MIELLDFQQKASATMADRFVRYAADPVITGTSQNQRAVPFFQALASITASGKTVILADAVSAISAALPVAPVVLWLSKGKVVVEQSLANLMPGGRYHHLLGGAEVRPLAEYDEDDVRDSVQPLIYFATVGTFNQKDKENGTLVIYRSELDTTTQSTWDALKKRPTKGGLQRPLLVVYDEAHNLSDQQTDLLMEQEPAGFLLASATMRLPQRLAREVELLRNNGWTDDTLTTSVNAARVATSGLVKNTLFIGGYKSPLEETISALMKDFREAEADAVAYGLPGLPKAIYVSNTNIVSGDAYQQDDPKQPFEARQAPPILIWRHLVEAHGVEPDDIAVYCSLKMDKNYPPPDGFHLFKGGDKDYATFTSRPYRHVIFNLGLQEGWDDPLCYFAYIDKSMESRVNVEQVVGRVLRQPGVKHYSADRLNTAHFYIRVDRNQVFADVLDAVGQKIKSEAPELRVMTAAPGKASPIQYAPKQKATIPTTAVDPADAVEPVGQLLAQLTDYRVDPGTNTKGLGSRSLVVRKVGADTSSAAQWESFEQSNRVTARWMFVREIRKRHPGALGVAPTSDPKFDALIGFGSNAEAHILQVAEQVVDAYVSLSGVTQKARDPYEVGPQMVRADEVELFTHALHPGYDRLNPLERAFGHALDGAAVLWARNPSRTGYGIPLPSLGPTNNFYPDFIVWHEDDVFVIDTKGGHLMAEAVVRKLLYIEPPRKADRRLFVKLVSPGKWTPKVENETAEGFTVWGAKAGGERTARHFDDLSQVVKAVLAPKRG